MKFLCFAYEEQRVLDELTPTEWGALRKRTLDYVAALQASGHLLDARPLGSATAAATVRVRNGKPSVTDGPYIETKEQIGGYFLIEAGGIDEAIRIAAGWPSAAIGTIEVRPVDEALAEDRRYR